MKVLHVSTGDVVGGAARGAFWLHRELLRQGVDSQMLVQRRTIPDPSIIGPQTLMQLGLFRSAAIFDQLPLRLYPSRKRSPWSMGLTPNDIVKHIHRVNPDIVHLHWIGFGFVPISAISKIGRPLIWTMRDMWPFTGGCHYSGDCTGYTRRCGRCPQLASNSDVDLSRLIWIRKRKHFSGSDMILVAISRWLADRCRSSSILAGSHIEVIPNGVSLSSFFPVDKSAARQALGLPSNRTLVGYGALHFATDEHKGFSFFVSAMQEIARCRCDPEPAVVLFGEWKGIALPDLGLEVHHLGSLQDDISLRSLYSAVDVLAAPSTQEAFGKVIIESMACGTPVVAFASGGPLDIIDHKINGYLADPFDSHDLATGIVWCAEESSSRSEIGSAAVQRVSDHFNISIIARQYKALYTELA